MITGASKGLGKEMALAFAKEGYRLAICARGEDQINQVKEAALNLGANEVLAIQADGANEKDVDRFVSITEATFGRIDILIVNASIFGPGPTLLADYPTDAFKEVLNTNVLHPFYIIRRVLPGMLSRSNGKIFILTSEAGKTGFATWGAYGISKFAVEGLSQTWADELSDSGVSITHVDPGEMNTEMHDIAVPDCDYELANPEDVAKVFVELTNQDSTSLNGQRIEAQNYKEVEAQ